MTGDYVPFIDDPEHLREVDGERYAVLRPTDAVVAAYSDVRTRLREVLAGSNASFPAYPHVTLRGWPKETDLDRVRDVVSRWSRRIPPLDLQIERVGTFPSPYRIVVVIVQKTPALRDAFTSLVAASADAGLPIWPAWTGDVDAWEFHMSVAYCSALDEEAWMRVAASAVAFEIPRAACEVREIEVAAFDDGRERSGGSFLLDGSR
ncbi:MAG TPA: 2'-5' RNA ligase family protein [Actinomycetota bacterium]|nr:2'-5' RNA ligase family protein [Actinomycetota bacterium]